MCGITSSCCLKLIGYFGIIKVFLLTVVVSYHIVNRKYENDGTELRLFGCQIYVAFSYFSSLKLIKGVTKAR